MTKRRNVYLLSTILCALLVLPWGLTQPLFLDDLRNAAFDRFQRAAPRRYDRDVPVRVVGVDDESLAAFGQWPWPRSRFAELNDKLAGLGAAAIAYDVLFAEADRLSWENVIASVPDKSAQTELARAMAKIPSNDEVFAKSIAAAPVALGMALVASGGEPRHPQKAGLVFAGDDPAPLLAFFPGAVAPIGVLAQAARGAGATNWLPDHDQIVRRTPLFVADPSGPAPSLALEALRIAQGETTYVIRSSNASGESTGGRQTGLNAIRVGSFEIAVGANGDVRPRYSYSAPERVISAAAVLRDRVDRSEIEGRIVFVGASAIGLGDVRATPLEPAVPGVEIHAQIIEALFSGQLLSRPDWAAGAEFFAALFLFAGVAALGLLVSPVASAFIGLATIAALFVGSFMLFDRSGLLIDASYPSLTIGCGYMTGAITLWQFERLAKRHVHQAFGKFLSPSVVDRLAEHPERLTLGGETRELTVLFSDLRNFSSLSEGMSAPELTHFMNEYLTPMTDAILDQEGTVDKYIGDAIMAFWNAPLDVPQHPRKAVRAALAMRSALEKFNAARAAKALERGVSHRAAAMGIGINLGLCSVGNMGSNRRFDYSVLGDAVNLASRLEGVSKIFKVDIIVSIDVREAASDFAWLDLGDVVVVGRAAPTSLYTPAGDGAFAQTEAFAVWKAAHDEMLKNYRTRQFAQAAAMAAKLSTDAPTLQRLLYKMFEERFAALAASQAQNDWSPVWTLGGKGA